MKTVRTAIWVAVVCAAVLFGVRVYTNTAHASFAARVNHPPVPEPTPTNAPTAKADVKSGGGLTTATFDTNFGKIRVHLPDDMRAGDTISGTVVIEAKGNTEQEKTANDSRLRIHVIQLDDNTMVEPTRPQFKWTPQVPTPPAPVRYVVRLFEVLDGKQTEVSNVQLSPGMPLPVEATGKVPSTPGSSNFVIPPLGQSGRTIVVTGPFDGDLSNTTLRYGPANKTVHEFTKVTDSVSDGFGVLRTLAESPRKIVFEVPTNVTGPIGIMVKEKDNVAVGTYRNVGVNLSAPKTNLLKGEKTTLTVQVSGLEGIKEPVPLTLESKGVITMEGGIYQPLIIQPSQVGADGRYTTTRGITGVQTGGWEATATVVTGRFNVWLQDDSDPNRHFHFNSFTGDYIFACGGGSCRPGGSTGGTQTGGTSDKPGETTLPGGTGPPPIVPPPPVTLTGTGKPAMKGCIITLSHNAPDRRVFAKLDACTKTGDASVETNSPKADIKITDKNTTDNTTASPPPK